MELKSAYEKQLLAFTGQVGDLAHREIKTVDFNCSLSQAAKLLIKPTINYLVVLRGNIPVGIVTKQHFSSSKLNTNELYTDYDYEFVSKIMDTDLISVQKNKPVFDTLMFMLKHNINSLLVMDGVKSIGIITQQDWLSVQVNYPTQLIKKIREAESILELSKLRKESKKVIWNTFEEEENAVSLTYIITVVNDAIGKRIQQLALLEMEAKGRGVPPVKFAWIGMGSEGRKAQTIRTDQDNGIIFEDVAVGKYKKVKNWFLAYAEIVVKGLNECGFPLCVGNIMATNPDLCNSLSKWKEHFEFIITKADAKQLLEASIYFDFRCIYGEDKLTNELWDYLFKRMKVHNFFMRHFSENLLEASRPPVRKWQWRMPSIFKIIPPPFDIKREGTAPLDAAIRLLALHNEIKETNTLKRLQRILEKGNMPKAMADSVHVAFDFILKLRFKLEFTMENEVNSSDHAVDPKDLSPIELRKLKEALKTIYELQDYAFKEVTEMSIPWSMK
ncbi:MAG: CBS domain-containing protein [Flavobacteriales bacterium]|nr:CBS domain-containing protein [Flavobacteriales bacterium]MCB9364183.1 CBS domain-containing protein [Flavobacteriales bacterium]